MLRIQGSIINIRWGLLYCTLNFIYNYYFTSFTLLDYWLDLNYVLLIIHLHSSEFLSKFVAQLVRASSSDLCLAKCYRFKPHPTRYFYQHYLYCTIWMLHLFCLHISSPHMWLADKGGRNKGKMASHLNTQEGVRLAVLRVGCGGQCPPLCFAILPYGIYILRLWFFVLG